MAIGTLFDIAAYRSDLLHHGHLWHVHHAEG